MSATTVTVSVPLHSIVKHFEPLSDPRHTRNRRHLLIDVITIAVCGVIVGCSGPSAIERWATAKKVWLKEVLALANGIPSRDCIRRILCALKPEAFQTCFQSWMASLLSEDEDKTVAIGGKTLRRSHDQSHELGPLHMVSAWASENGLALGQVVTEEKSNEITAIPALIDRIDVKGAIVTIDECTTDVCDSSTGQVAHPDTGLCGACCLVDKDCVARVLAGTCGGLGGAFLGQQTECLGDSDGDGIDDQCDNCPGVDDAVCGVFICSESGFPCESGDDCAIGEVCEKACIGKIPTVSEWGLIVLSLLLLTAGKVYFGHRDRRLAGA